MSVDEESRVMLPPENKFFAMPDGLKAWRPEFESIKVRAALNGGRILIVNGFDGTFYERLLSREEAAHLARLLTEGVERPAAAPAPVGDTSPRPQAAE